MKLPIPESALAQHVIALGKTRSGKSSKMRVIVEHLLDAEKPVCIIDPKGDWWGLKSSADSKHAGYPVVIFGGPHADVPLDPRSGAAIAELIFTGNRPALIDLKGWMPRDRTKFFIDFASTVFRVTSGERYLVIDEAHNFAPKGKVLSPEAGEMLHWANRLASEGQGMGLILLAASQRPQKVHNDLLTSCETLIACRVIHKADRDAVKDWIDGCADPSIGNEVLKGLAGMKRSDAWVWSPEVEFGPKLVSWPLFRTYDSFKPQPPQAGKLKGWADVDLAAVREKLKVAIAEAEANDPKMLRKRIADLEHQLRGRPGAAPAASREDLKAAELRGAQRERQAIVRDLAAWQKGLRGQLHKAFDESLKEIRLPDSLGQDPGAAAPIKVPHTTTASPQAIQPVRRESPPAKVPHGGNGIGEQLPKVQRKFLVVLAQREGRATARNQVAIFAGYSSKSGHIDNTLSALRTAGYVQGSGEDIRITADGLRALGDFEPLPSGEDLRRYWLQHAGGKAESAMLGVIFEAYPYAITRNDVAERAGYSVSSGHIDNVLSRLRTLDLIIGSGSAIRASEDLFS